MVSLGVSAPEEVGSVVEAGAGVTVSCASLSAGRAVPALAVCVAGTALAAVALSGAAVTAGAAALDAAAVVPGWDGVVAPGGVPQAASRAAVATRTMIVRLMYRES